MEIFYGISIGKISRRGGAESKNVSDVN